MRTRGYCLAIGLVASHDHPGQPWTSVCLANLVTTRRVAGHVSDQAETPRRWP
jgi:hypothetical protein